MKRPPLVHLLLIAAALAVLAVGAWYYTNASEPVEGIPVVPNTVVLSGDRPTTKDACEVAGGVWNECASSCPPGAQACVQVCVKKCDFPGEGLALGKFRIYFPNGRLGSEDDCSKVFPVLRSTNGDVDVFGELLKGPTKEESARGYTTSIPAGTQVRTVTNGAGAVWTIDFSKEMGSVAGACRTTAVRAQIERSLREQVPDANVRISVEGGDPDDALQP